MTSVSRTLVVALSIAYALVAVVPVVDAAADLKATSGQRSILAVHSDDDGSDAATPLVSVVHLGPLDYVLEKVDEVYEKYLQTDGGFQCAYDTGSERNSLVCYCFSLDWSCGNTILDQWACYMSAGPQTNNQVGIVCFPPRSATNLS